MRTPVDQLQPLLLRTTLSDADVSAFFYIDQSFTHSRANTLAVRALQIHAMTIAPICSLVTLLRVQGDGQDKKNLSNHPLEGRGLLRAVVSQCACCSKPIETRWAP